MKKFLAIVCTAGMVLTLGGCSFGEKPDVVVSTFCEALKTYDMQAAAACVTTEETVLPEMEMEDDEIEALFADVFAEKCDTVETSTATATVTFLCQKTDGEWKIYDVAEEDATALLMVMTCNLSSAMEELDASFSY